MSLSRAAAAAAPDPDGVEASHVRTRATVVHSSQETGAAEWSALAVWDAAEAERIVSVSPAPPTTTGSRA